MRVLKISFMIFILIGSFAAIQANAEASSHKVVLAPPSGHRATATPHSVPSQRNFRSGTTGKTVLPYPQGYTSRHYYPYHNYYYPYRSFYSFGFGYSPYLSYGFWPWYYGGYYSPYYYSPYYGGGYGYGYGYSPYYRGGYYGYGELRIEVKPKTAKVYVDGDYVGVVDDYDGWWQRLKLEPGRHRIVIREGGYVPYAQTVRIVPGDDTHIKALMQPGRDQITEDEMRLPPGERDRYNHDRYYRDHRDDQERRPYGDDRYRDQDRDRDRDYDRDNDDSDNDNDNDHSQLEMQHDGENQPERDRDYASNDQRYESNAQHYPSNDQPRVQDQRSNRNFTVEVEPHDATIYIDGNYYGTADVNPSGQVQVLLPEGKHKLEVVRPGYESFNQDITVSNQDNKLAVQLHKK